MFAGGKTESTLNQVKIPGIEMMWLEKEGLFFVVGHQSGLIPAAAVKNSLFP